MVWVHVTLAPVTWVALLWRWRLVSDRPEADAPGRPGMAAGHRVPVRKLGKKWRATSNKVSDLLFSVL
jgi:hypothetical protein